MVVRQLQPDEYHRILSPPHPALGALRPSPSSSIVIIGEEADEIISLWTAIDIIHLEAFWIHPDHRKKHPRLPIRMVSLMKSLLSALHIPAAFCWTADDQVASYVERLGGVKLPLSTYHFPTGSSNGSSEVPPCQP